MLAKTDPRSGPNAAEIDSKGEGPLMRDGARFYRRRALATRDLLPAIGAGIVVGAAAMYLAQLLLRRTPLNPQRPPVGLRRLPSRGG